MLGQQLLDTSRGRIVGLLGAGRCTADDIATKLGLTPSAVRLQLGAMERDGVVRKVRKGLWTTRPSVVYELTPEIDQLPLILTMRSEVPRRHGGRHRYVRCGSTRRTSMMAAPRLCSMSSIAITTTRGSR
jgi:predicted ArsR family transcriptional regulator